MRALRQRDDAAAMIEPVAADIGRRVAYRPDATTGKTVARGTVTAVSAHFVMVRWDWLATSAAMRREDLAWLEAPPAKTLEQGQN